MSNGIKYFVTFALGAAAGSVVAWSFLKSKYEQLAKEEIEEVREYYRQKDVESEGEDEPAFDEEDSNKYESIVACFFLKFKSSSISSLIINFGPLNTPHF